MENTVVWRKGFGESRYKGVSATKVYREIREIGDSATPEQIVDAARNENSELHKCFTWDDALAAEHWRKQEARQLRYFLVISNDNKPSEPQLTAFHYTVQGDGYKPAALVFQNPDEYTALLKRAYAELRAFSQKYQRLKNELGEIFVLIDSLPE